MTKLTLVYLNNKIVLIFLCFYGLDLDTRSVYSTHSFFPCRSNPRHPSCIRTRYFDHHNCHHQPISLQNKSVNNCLSVCILDPCRYRHHSLGFVLPCKSDIDNECLWHLNRSSRHHQNHNLRDYCPDHNENPSSYYYHMFVRLSI